MRSRIAIVVNTLSGGGAEKTAANLSRVLSERYEVDVVVNDKEHLEYPCRGRVISLGMPGNTDRMNAAYQMKALVRRVRVLKKMKKKRRYAAVLSFSEMTNLANVLSRTRGTKTVISVRNSVKNSKTEGWKHRLVAEFIFPFCFKRADATVSCSKEIADELICKYGLPEEKSQVICNGIELGKIRDNASESLTEDLYAEDGKLVVSVGRLTRQKGQWHLLRAAKNLIDEGIPLNLVILGEGELRMYLEKMICGSGLEKSVFLPGFLKNPHRYMAKADAVVFPSLYEGFSNAIAEALACGAPVISSDHETGAREILAPDTDYHRKAKNKIDEAEYGILVPVCDGKFRHADEPLTKEERLLAEAIKRILTDSSLQEHYREAARRRALQLKIESVAEQWIRVIEN